MSRLLFSTLCLLAGVSPLASAAPALPEHFVATFDLRSRGVTLGHTRWSLQSTGEGRFVYESRTEPAGWYAIIRKDRILERSEWRLADQWLQPLAYRYQRTGAKKQRDVRIDFDWEQGIARNTVHGQTWQMEIPPGTLDKLNYVLALMLDLARGKREIDYTIADGGKLKHYRLKLLGDERLDTRLGRLATVKVVRERIDSSRKTTLWCAPSLAFLPVKIEHRERDGSRVSLLLNSAEGFAGVSAAGADTATAQLSSAGVIGATESSISTRHSNGNNTQR